MLSKRTREYSRLHYHRPNPSYNLPGTDWETGSRLYSSILYLPSNNLLIFPKCWIIPGTNASPLFLGFLKLGKYTNTQRWNEGTSQTLTLQIPPFMSHKSLRRPPSSTRGRTEGARSPSAPPRPLQPRPVPSRPAPSPPAPPPCKSPGPASSSRGGSASRASGSASAAGPLNAASTLSGGRSTSSRHTDSV